MRAPLIEFQQATVTHGTHVALNNLTLSIASGEHVAILGPNGSGKSTLIKTITRDCYPRQRPGPPAVRILGEEVWNIFELLPLLGIVSNDLLAKCNWHISGMGVVLSGYFSSIGIWPNHTVSAAMEAGARGIMKRLGIAHLADQSILEMLTGEARRCLIGRALVHEPAAILLDEPSASLDLAAAAGLHDSMRRLAQSGTAIILVTHHLPDIIPEIARVILLKQGGLFADGPKAKILTEPMLSNLFGTRVDVTERKGCYNAW